MSRKKSDYFISESGDLDSNRDPLPGILQDLIETIEKNFRIVSTFPDADLILNTQQFTEKLQEIYPAEYTGEQVYNAMISAGYEPQLTEDMQFVWLFKNI